MGEATNCSRHRFSAWIVAPEWWTSIWSTVASAILGPAFLTVDQALPEVGEIQRPTKKLLLTSQGLPRVKSAQHPRTHPRMVTEWAEIQPLLSHLLTLRYSSHAAQSMSASLSTHNFFRRASSSRLLGCSSQTARGVGPDCDSSKHYHGRSVRDLQ